MMQTKTLMTLANEHLFDELEEAWMTALDAVPIPMVEMLHVVEWLAKAKEPSRAEVLLDTLVEALEQHRSMAEVLDIAGRGMHLFPENARLRAAYGRALCVLNPENPALPGIVAKSGLTSGGPVDVCLADIEHKRSIRAGAFALHCRRRIPVRIEAYDPDADAVILSDGTEKYPTGMSTYLDQYEPLDPHDFRAMKTFNREILAEMAESDPEHLVLSYLKFAGRQSTFRDFRDTLQACAVAPEDWKTWWARVKTLLVKNPMMDLGEGAQPSLALRDSPRDFSAHLIREFDFATHPRMKPAMAIHYLHATKSGTPLSDDITGHFNTQLATMVATKESDPLAFAAWLALATVAQDQQKEEPAYSPAWMATDDACAEFGHWCGWESLYVAPCMKLVPAADPEWPALLARIVPFAPMAMIEQIVTAVMAAGHADALNQAVMRLAEPSVANAEAFAWMWRMLATDGQPSLVFPIDLMTATMGMFKLTRLLSVAVDTPEQNMHETLAALRLTLSYKKFDVAKSVFQKIGPEHAVVLYQIIQGNTGLSTPMRSQLVHILSRSGSIGGKA